MSKQLINVELKYIVDYQGFEGIIPDRRLDEFVMEALKEVQVKRDIVKFNVIASITRKVTEYLSYER